MRLSTVLLGIYLILVGLNLLGVLSISNVVLGIIALIAGILLLVESIHPIVIPIGHRQTQV